MVAARSTMSRTTLALAGRIGARLQCVVSVPLLVMGQETAAQTRPATPVVAGFSHVAIPLDSATFQAIATSAFLRTEFGGFEERLGGQAISDTLLFYYGRDSWLEFLNRRPLLPVGSEQLVFVVNRPGIRLSQQPGMQVKTVAAALEIHPSCCPNGGRMFAMA